MREPTRDQIEALVREAAAARLRSTASARTAPGQALLRLTSSYSTRERAGVRPYRPGDSVRRLKTLSLAARDALEVREDLLVAETAGCVLLDDSRTLLADPATGPFAVGLAALVLAAYAAEDVPTFLGLLGEPVELYRFGRGRAAFARVVEALARVEPRARPQAGGSLPARVGAALQARAANLNVHAVLHAGYPAHELDGAIEVLRGQGRQAAVWLCIAEEEWDVRRPEVTDPETGEAVVLESAAAPSWFEEALGRAEALGRHAGVPVRPLAVRDWRADLSALIPFLRVSPT
jgi:hypothetical protein